MSPAGPKRSGGGAMHLEIVRMQATQSEEKVDGLTQGMKRPIQSGSETGKRTLTPASVVHEVTCFCVYNGA
jgi:hypothetical protein